MKLPRVQGKDGLSPELLLQVAEAGKQQPKCRDELLLPWLQPCVPSQGCWHCCPQGTAGTSPTWAPRSRKIISSFHL